MCQHHLLWRQVSPNHFLHKRSLSSLYPSRSFTPSTYHKQPSQYSLSSSRPLNSLGIRLSRSSKEHVATPHLFHSLAPLSSAMSLRRAHTDEKAKVKETHLNGATVKDNGHDHEPPHTHDHDHAGHSHSLFGHSHSHGEDGHSHGAVAALEAAGDRGTQITLLGLFSNVALTGAKGFAGWYMHSASLLADAGHSLSDLLGDFVTLFCWKLSRGPPTERYPYGFAKFETLGTTTISLLLIGGALGIGFHSYHLLINALSETASTLPVGPLQEMLRSVTSAVPLPSHAHVHSVDPNAAWFAAVSVLVKEWLYRATKVVADEEKSPVLLANAIHHRSDAYSSLVAFFAIVGTWLYPALPLDPIGGLIVSIVILRQGFDLLFGAWGDLTDAGVSPRTRRSLEAALKPLLSTQVSQGDDDPLLLGVHHIRGRRAGSMLFVDLTVDVSASLTVTQTSALERRIADTLREARKEISEVRIQFNPVTRS